MPFYRGYPRQRGNAADHPTVYNKDDSLVDAVRSGDVQHVAAMLRDPTCDVNAVEFDPDDCSETTALLLVARLGRADMAKLLLAHRNVLLSVVNELGETPLIVASKCGNVGVVDLLLKHVHVQVNELSRHYSRTALMYACDNGHTDVVAALLQHKDINVNLENESEETALMFAANAAILRMLLARPEIHSINKRNTSGNAVVNHAAWRGLTDVMQVLLAQPDIDVNFENRAGNTVLYHACSEGFPEVACMLLAWPHINVNFGSRTGCEPLMAPCIKGQATVVRMMLTKPDINVNLFKDGTTPLHAAIKHDHLDVVDALLDGAPCLRADRRDDYGLTGFEYAMKLKRYYIAERFVHHDVGDIPLVYENALLLEYLAPWLSVVSARALLLRDLPVHVANGVLRSNESHSYSWSKFLDSSVAVPPSVRIDTIRSLHTFASVVDNAELIKELAYAKDEHGRDALHTTDATTREFLKGVIHFCGRYDIFDGPPIHVSATAVVVHAYDHGICMQVFDEFAEDNGQLTEDGFVACSQTLGRLSTDRNATHMKFEREADSWKKEFELWDKDGNREMSAEEFLRYCGQYFGGKLKVAMKFMRHKDEYDREVRARRGLDPTCVLALLPSLDATTFATHVGRLKLHDDALDMAVYPHVVVMPAADRSLEDIFQKERPSDKLVRSMLFDVTTALRHLHDHGLVHGDVKKLNVLRVHNQLKLIDLDAAVRIGHPVGMKFSSGNLPPEMFYVLRNADEADQVAQYWRGVDADEWRKVKPRENVVVKSFRPEFESQDGALPYDLVDAAEALDVWALGCMMYQMWSGVELNPTDVNQDVVSDRMLAAASWTDELLSQRLRANIADPIALDLASRLLIVDPNARWNLDRVLSHAYFSGEVATSALVNQIVLLEQSQHDLNQTFVELTATLQETTIAANVRDRVREAQESIVRAVFDVSGVSVPTSFVLLPPVGSDASTKSPADVNSTIAFLGHLFQFGAAIADTSSSSDESARAVLANAFAADGLDLYLVDEMTGDVVRDDPNGVYPIHVPINSMFIAAALPCVQGALALLQKCHGVSFVLSLVDSSLGVAVDKSVPRELESTLQSILPLLTTPLGPFEVATASSDGTVNNANKLDVRAHELEQFFAQHDVDRTFAGLSRKLLADGRVVWTKEPSTTPTCVDSV
ncbi:serine/threonine protein kinase [Aphanomyces invadans]|uniref:Serine/threonine protein kinase n=1 Tax=Aphanomyces invadans TaxID=157072 RepID=A0A024U6T9_9STRA|nr:serine/threonine protein kinase [Aphanomyces invadans]ETW01979.1 serine/threonine protein kinase [Aphanomyces invadans]|eukprot:XP_008869827.1 serine/threonine protein kinase [Aphanomyces invadans]